MKLNGSVLVAVAMMFGSIGAIGCKSGENAQPENVATESPAAEPAKTETASEGATKTDESVNVQAKASIGVGNERPTHRYVPMAPPAPRYERIGRAPSTRHFWVNGHYKWANGRYIWIGGHWDTRRGNRVFVQPHYDRVDGKWRYVPGHWA